MDGTVIPLSTVRAQRGTAPREEVALLSLELHQRERGTTTVPSLEDDIRRKVHDRCIRAALVVAGRRGALLSLAGTSAHPVVDALFRGEGAALTAADAAVEIGHAVREAQRSGERAIVISAAIGTGSCARTSGGVSVTSGSPARVAERLRERARPGELLLGGAAAEPVAGELNADVAAATAIDASIGTVPVWRLPITSHPSGTIE
jgi:class 3 adenylate cyclase